MSPKKEYHMLVHYGYPLADREVVGFYYPGIGYRKVSGWSSLLNLAASLEHFDGTQIEIAETEEENRAIWESLGDRRKGVTLDILLFDFEIETVMEANGLVEDAANIVLSEMGEIDKFSEEEANDFRKAYQMLLISLDHEGDPFHMIHYLCDPEMLIWRKASKRKEALPEMMKAARLIADARDMLSDQRYNTGRVSARTYITR